MGLGLFSIPTDINITILCVSIPIFELVVTVLSHRCNSRTDSGEATVENRASSETLASQGHNARLNPEGNTEHLAMHATGVAREHPFLPNPPLTRTTLGQLCLPGRGRLRQSLDSNPEPSLVLVLAL